MGEQETCWVILKMNGRKAQTERMKEIMTDRKKN
jgi:hypothetical protein